MDSGGYINAQKLKRLSTYKSLNQQEFATFLHPVPDLVARAMVNCSKPEAPTHGRKPEFLTTDSPFRHLRGESAVRRIAEGRSENQVAWAAVRGPRHAARAAWSVGHARRAAAAALADRHVREL